MKICKVEKKREVVDTSYEVCNEYCCDTMKQWLNINRYSNRHTMWYDTETERFTLEVRTAYDGYSTYDDTETSVKRDMIYCPFCGTRLQETIIEEPKKKSWRKKK